VIVRRFGLPNRKRRPKKKHKDLIYHKACRQAGLPDPKSHAAEDHWLALSTAAAYEVLRLLITHSY